MQIRKNRRRWSVKRNYRRHSSSKEVKISYQSELIVPAFAAPVISKQMGYSGLAITMTYTKQTLKNISKQRTANNIRSMSNQRGTAHHRLATPSDEIQRLQSEMAQLTANVARLTAQQTVSPPRNLMPSTRPLAGVDNAGDRLSGAHLQMCSYHGCCTHNDASCGAQHPNSAGPSKTTATGASHCYF
uniref:Uncharacterized protein n=1 Tax=Romanomermis culicivorax TaxID=13658 RepID=A0A915IA71_ROMCU